MDNVNKTLYIPLYGKSYVSGRGIILSDQKAQEIWAKEGFPLKGKSGSKWLAFYMGVRAAVFDEWIKQNLADDPHAVVVHIGCGLDSRVLRIGDTAHKWYDVDFPQVIRERERYYTQSAHYQMIAGDARDPMWLSHIKETESAVVVMEGVSMYLTVKEMQVLTDRLCSHFERLTLLVDCYTTFAAKMSRHQNPINDVGVTQVYGIDDPRSYQCEKLGFVKEHTMIPQRYIDQLSGWERFLFAKLYAGGFSKKLYRLFEYQKR